MSDFDDGTTKAVFGSGWDVSTDDVAGGKSKAEIAVVSGGVAGSRGSLTVSGTVAPGLAYAWAGAMFSPGVAPMAPANLSSKKAIRFWARGDGKTYRIMVFAQSRGFTPITQNFAAEPEWKEYVLPLASFSGIDGKDIMAVIFAGGPQPGTFAFQIDGVRFQ